MFSTIDDAHADIVGMRVSVTISTTDDRLMARPAFQPRRAFGIFTADGCR